MTACERLLECLKAGGKVFGFRKPITKADGKVVFAKQMVEVRSGDLLEACQLVEGSARNDNDNLVEILQKGAAAIAGPKGPDAPVSLYADDVFHVLDAVKAGKG